MNICELYNDGYGTNEIAKIFNIHRATVQRILKRNNIKLRKSTPRIKYDIKYFSTINEFSSYWAGFIAADGCIRSDRNTLLIHLAIKDVDHLEKFKKSINLQKNVEIFDKSCRLSVHGPWYVEDLKKNFNITPKKTHTYNPPQKLPNDMIKHFIRGYFDGDGSISISSCPYIAIFGTKQMCSYFNNYASLQNVKLKSKNILAPIIQRDGTMMVSYSGKNAKKILDDMYDGANIFLDRKHIRYKDYFYK